MIKDETIRSLQIRTARKEDAGDLARLLDDLGFPTSANSIEARLIAMSDLNDLLLVAVRNDQTLGLLTVHLNPVLHRAG